jgi:hypothetical protein
METTNKIILGAISILIAVILITIVADQMSSNVSVTEVLNKSVDLSSAKINGKLTSVNQAIFIAVPEAYNTTADPKRQWKIDTSDCGFTLEAARNATAGTDGTLLVNTDINMSSKGYIALTNTTRTGNATATDNLTYIDYTYCSDNYVASSWGRAVMKVALGLIAVLILAMGIGLLYQVYEEAKGK